MSVCWLVAVGLFFLITLKGRENTLVIYLCNNQCTLIIINSLQACPFSFHCRAGLYYLEMQYHALSDRLMIVADQASITDGHPCLPSVCVCVCILFPNRPSQEPTHEHTIHTSL